MKPIDHLSPAQLPVVDIAPALTADPDFDSVAADIARAVNLSGFFYLRGHGIDPARLRSLVVQMREFFEADPVERAAVRINQNNRGWLAPGEARMKGARLHDLKEVFFFGRELADDDPDLLAGVPLCAPNQWPPNRPAFKAATLAYLADIHQAARALLGGFARHLGREANFFERFYERPMTRGQLIHYPTMPDAMAADQFGVAEHSDFGCITLLHQETPGLEVLTRQGVWMTVPPVSGHLVVNIGDLLERWTDGALPSTRHRVRNLTGASRYSIAIFYDPSPTAIIDPADLCTPRADGTPRQSFQPIGAADYIMSQNRAVFAQYR